MLDIKQDHIVSKLPGVLLVALALLWAWTSMGLRASAQQNRSARTTDAHAGSTAQPKGEDEPPYSEYKGVHIGMTTDEARAKLGSPQDKSDDQDFFVFNEKESAQVFYDKTHKTYAISINYLGAGSSTPMPKAVVGSEIEAKPDGSMYKMVRYPKAKFWISYSRTAGNDPLITVTLQRID
jgi:hypothetical protein